MSLTNGSFKPYLNSFVIVFVHDLLVYSKSKKEHENNFIVVLDLLKEKHLYVKFSKYEVLLLFVSFLGNLICIK